MINAATVDANDSTFLAGAGAAPVAVDTCFPPIPSSTRYTTRTGNHATRSYQFKIRYPKNEILSSLNKVLNGPTCLPIEKSSWCGRERQAGDAHTCVPDDHDPHAPAHPSTRDNAQCLSAEDGIQDVIPHHPKEVECPRDDGTKPTVARFEPSKTTKSKTYPKLYRACTIWRSPNLGPNVELQASEHAALAILDQTHKYAGAKAESKLNPTITPAACPNVRP
jgi:hypothetical protein